MMNVKRLSSEHRGRRGRLAFLVAGLAAVLLMVMGSLTTRAAPFAIICWDGSVVFVGICPSPVFLDIAATVAGEHSQTYGWDVELTGDASYAGYFGNDDSWHHEFTVTANKLDVVDRWRVSGTMTIDNSTTYAAIITEVRSEISGVGLATVDCPVTFPYTLPASQSLICSFSGPLPDGTARTHTANVITTDLVLGRTDDDSITFGPPVLLNEEINVSTSDGEAWLFADDGQETYEKFLACDFDSGTHVTTLDVTETGQTDSAVVTVACTDDSNGLLFLKNETYPAGGWGFHFTLEPIFQAAWTTADGPADPLLPSRLDVDSDGNVYVSTYGNRVVKLSNDGGYVDEWGDLGGALDVAVDGDNNVYVLDNVDSNIRKYDSNGVLLDTSGGPGGGKGQLSSPLGLAVDEAGNVYVADTANDRLSIFNSDGDFVAMWGKNVVAGNAETGYEICTSAPADTCQGNQPGSGDGEFDNPFDVAVDSAGNVYVADAGNSRIQKFSSDGSFLMAWGQYGAGDGEFDLIAGLGVDVRDYVYAVDYHNHRVQKFAGDGVHIATWGGPAAGSGQGEFNQPIGIAFDDANHAFVSEESGARVQKFVSAGAGLDDQQTASFVLPPGTYEVVNVMPDGWFWDAIDCNAPFVDNGDSVTVEVDAGDYTGCLYGHVTVDDVADLDGVSDAIEDGAPNGGDGNNDGIPDSEQSNVTSLPSATSGLYETVVAGTLNRTISVTTSTPSAVTPLLLPTGTTMPTGVTRVRVATPSGTVRGYSPLTGMRAAAVVGPQAVVEPEAVQLTLFFEGNPSFDSYYKFGPTPDNTDPHWYEFLYDGQTGAELLSDRIILYFVDGARGDSDLTINGVIDDPVGPVVITDAELTVIKEVSGMAPAEWSFAVAAPGLSPNALALTDDDPDHTYSNVAPGQHTLTETDQPGWIPSVSCQPGGETGGNAVTVDLEAGEDGICRFTNQICFPGTYDNGTACVDAAAGYYTDSAGSSTQTACAPGFFQSNPGQPGCFGASEGHYAPGPGATAEIECELGTYQPDPNQSSCLTAGAGFYVPTTGATSQTACPSGTTSPPGSDNIADCVPVTANPVEVYVSTTTAGTIPGGPAFGFEDILRFDGTDWTVFFDGSAVGLVPRGKAAHDINAFSLPDPSGDDVVIAFTQNSRHVPGIAPMVQGMDLVWWDGSAFSLWFDGSDVGLTSMSAEKIDGLHVLGGADAPGMFGGQCDHYLLISTQARASVRKFGGGKLNASGEDVLGFCMTNSGDTTTGYWHMVLDGSAQGMPLHSTVSLSLSEDGETLYLTTKGTFFVDGAAGGHSMVYAYDMDGGLFSGPHFKAVDEGLSNKVDGLQVVGDLR